MLMGTLIVLAAFEFGPMSGARMNVPRWVIGLCGLLFASAGVIVIAPTQTMTSVAAGVVVVVMTVICITHGGQISFNANIRTNWYLTPVFPVFSR